MPTDLHPATHPLVGNGTIPRALWDHLPLGAGVVDMEGRVRIANQRLVEMAGFTLETDLIGKSAFDWVDPDDLEAFAAGFDRGPDFPDTVLGPLYFRFRDRFQRVHATECWAYAAPAELGFEGYVITLADESTADLLAAATRGIAVGDDVLVSLARIADALRAYPVSSTGSILVVENGEISDIAGTWAFPDLRCLRHLENPWGAVASGALRSGAWTIDQLPAATARLARRHGFGSVWARAIDTDNRRRGVLVAWRPTAVAPTPNQIAHLREAATAASLAFSQSDHRRQLQRAALEDHLTGVGNRARLAVRGRAAPDGPTGVLFIDLDFFKQVNDRHGHHVGDRVLRIAAERLTRLARPQDEVYRVGGDEFVIVCGPSADAATAHTLVEQMARFVVEAIGQPFDLGGTTISIGASVGVAVADGGLGLDDVLDRADDALFEAKRAGRGRWSATSLAECG